MTQLVQNVSGALIGENRVIHNVFEPRRLWIPDFGFERMHLQNTKFVKSLCFRLEEVG